MDKYSSLLVTFINYGRKKIKNIYACKGSHLQNFLSVMLTAILRSVDMLSAVRLNVMAPKK